MKPDWLKDVNPDYVPYIEKLWEDGKVYCESTYEATAVKDIVQHYTHETVVIEAIDGKIYAIFSHKVGQ